MAPLTLCQVVCCFLVCGANLHATEQCQPTDRCRSFQVSNLSCRPDNAPHTHSVLFGGKRAYREGLMTGSVLSRCPAPAASGPVVVLGGTGGFPSNGQAVCPPCPPCPGEMQGNLAHRSRSRYPIVSSSHNSLVLRVRPSAAPQRVFYQGRWWVQTRSNVHMNNHTPRIRRPVTRSFGSGTVRVHCGHR